MYKMVLSLCPCAQHDIKCNALTHQTHMWLQGSCPGFKESLEGYLQTAGTANKRMVDMFYNGLIHPISVDGFQADLTNFNTSATFPPEGSNLTCNCLAYDQDPCQGELSDISPLTPAASHAITFNQALHPHFAASEASMHRVFAFCYTGS